MGVAIQLGYGIRVYPVIQIGDRIRSVAERWVRYVRFPNAVRSYERMRVVQVNSWIVSAPGGGGPQIMSKEMAQPISMLEDAVS